MLTMTSATSAILVALLCLISTFLSSPVPQQGHADPLLSGHVASGRRVPIAILHMHDSVSFFRRLGAITGENKRRYAARHGYDMIESTPLKTTGILKPAPCEGRVPDAKGHCWEEDKDFDIDHSRAPTFGKVKLSLAACQGRDDGWLLWMDADAMVVNQTVPLETLIDDGYDMMLAYDWLMLNAGILLMKCSDWTKNLLHNVYDARKFDTARALDQSSFQEHLDNLTKAERDAHVKVVPKYAMNVYTEEYRPGDFLLHMAGKLYEATEPGIVAIAQQYDILSMIDDIEDIRAFFRGTRLLNYYSGTCKVSARERQSNCRPDDPRRILLNESLGSMSYPNRYRHVGLRYYWLGNWKDTYDVPGWDVKKKTLPLPERPPPGKDMPPIPVGALHQEEHGEVKDSHESKGKDTAKHGVDDHDDKGRLEVPEVDHEQEVKHHEENKRQRASIEDKSDNVDDEDDEVSNSWPLWIQVLVASVCVASLAGFVFVLRKRKQKSSKIQ